MGFFPKVLTALLVLSGPSAWAFCDGEGTSGGANCHQLDSVEPLTYGGSLTTRYADARGDAIMGAVAANVRFYVDLSRLVRQGTSSQTVFAELLISNSFGTARTLVLKFRNDGGAYSIVQEWWSARAFWSTADEIGNSAVADARTLVSSQTCTIGFNNVSNVYVEVVPHGGWDSFEVNVPSSDCGAKAYAMSRPVSGSPNSLLRLRTGVISSTTLWEGMSVGFMFLFPGETS